MHLAGLVSWAGYRAPEEQPLPPVSFVRVGVKDELAGWERSVHDQSQPPSEP